MSQTGYSNYNLHVCEVIEAANAFKMSTSQPLAWVIFHLLYLLGHQMVTGPRQFSHVGAMTVKTTWSDPY